MQNPQIQFPYYNETKNGDPVYSGVMPHSSGGWYAIAYCPTADGNTVRTTQYLGFQTLEEAVDAAQNKAPSWYSKVAIGLARRTGPQQKRSA